MSCCRDSAVVITSAGEAFGYGMNDVGQLCLSDNSTMNNFTKITSLQAYHIVAIDAGTQHTSFVTDDGQLLVCGSNAKGGICLPLNVSMTFAPQIIPLPIGVRAVSVDCMKQATLVLTDESARNVWGCGLNDQGQLGINKTTNSANLVQITGEIGHVRRIYGRSTSVLLLDGMYSCL